MLQTAVQLVIQYWNTNFPGYAVSLIFWVVLIAINVLTVRAYGEVGDHPYHVNVVLSKLALILFRSNIGSVC